MILALDNGVAWAVMGRPCRQGAILVASGLPGRSSITLRRHRAPTERIARSPIRGIRISTLRHGDPSSPRLAHRPSRGMASLRPSPRSRMESSPRGRGGGFPFSAHESSPPGPPRPRLLDRVRAALRIRHYSRRTEEAYVAWILRHIRFPVGCWPSSCWAMNASAFTAVPGRSVQRSKVARRGELFVMWGRSRNRIRRVNRNVRPIAAALTARNILAIFWPDALRSRLGAGGGGGVRIPAGL
jgi:hypothetical protein